MKTFKSFISEKQFADLKAPKNNWITIPNDAFDPELSAELFDLIDKSYSYVGGHANYKTAADIPFGKDSKDPGSIIWYGLDFDEDPEADVINISKQTAFGLKSVAGATDGSKEAKDRYVKNMVDSLNTSGNYAEVSGAIMHILISKYGVESIESQEDVEKILGKTVSWVGENPNGKYPGYNGFYNRSICGTEHMKIMLGKPKL